MDLALRSYESDLQTLPTTEEGLNPLTKFTMRGSSHPVCEPKDLFDAWRHPFRYARPSRDGRTPYEVWSVGPDGRSGTADDISTSSQE